MLSLAGVPGIYVHSLFGSRNCLDCVEETNRFRSINREKFDLSALNSEINDSTSMKSAVFAGYRKLLAVRKEQAAFHPTATQLVFNSDNGVFSLLRKSQKGDLILCLINVTDEQLQISISSEDYALPEHGIWNDLLSNVKVNSGKDINFELQAYQCCWFRFVD